MTQEEIIGGGWTIALLLFTWHALRSTGAIPGRRGWGRWFGEIGESVEELRRILRERR